LAQAATALGDGDFVHARELAQKARAATQVPLFQERARLIEGVSARGLSDFAGAVQALTFAPSHLGDLEPYRQLYLGDARFYGGDPVGAAEAFGAARTAAKLDSLAIRASGRQGDAYLEAGQPCPAIQDLQSGTVSDETPERLESLARAQEGCKGAKEAQLTRHHLWLQFPEHQAAQKLEAEQAPTATAGDRYSRASKLFARAEPGRAAAEAELGLKLKPSNTLRAALLVLKGKALIETHSRTTGFAALNLAIKIAPKSESAAEAQTIVARSLWRNGKITDAETLLQQIAKEHKDRIGEDAAYLYAFMPFDRANGDTKAYSEAARRFGAFIKEHPHSHKADEAAWFAAYSAFRAGQKELARKSFAQLANDYPSSALHPQGLYWEARTSKPKDAEALYRATIRSAPYSYYAAMSRARLNELKADPEPALTPVSLPDPVSKPLNSFEAGLARQLNEVGLLPERDEALDAAARATSNSDDVLALAALEVHFGDWGRAYSLANSRLWHKAFEEKVPGAVALFYPQAFPVEVQAAATAFGFDPMFAWSIMRRESAFDPRVESSARAIGLMQLLSPTARKIGSVLGQFELPSSPDLHEAEREIPYAVWYLSELAGRFDHAGLVAAGYNAGPKNVAHWLQQNGTMPFDEFVEAIPFRETRLYVKGVLGDYFTYRALYPVQAPALPVDWALEEVFPGADF
jgi:soluble lytic murein transglycosylase